MKYTNLNLRIPQPEFKSHRLMCLLPSPGNVIFTVLVIGSLLWAQSAGAINLAAPVVDSSLTIPYQGRLANASGTPFTGNQNMEFRLYNVPSGGTPLWSELWTGGNSVAVNDGLFSVLLGSLTAGLPAVVQGNGQLWLGITVGTDGEMSPRVQLGSAAYSMQALTVPDGSVTSAKLKPTIGSAVISSDQPVNLGAVWTPTTVPNTSLNFTLATPSRVLIWFTSTAVSTNIHANNSRDLILRVDGSSSYISSSSSSGSVFNFSGVRSLELGAGSHTIEFALQSGFVNDVVTFSGGRTSLVYQVFSQ